jgi:hypothetical protein
MANIEITIKTIIDKAIADLKKTAGAVNEVDNSAQKGKGGISDFSGAMLGLNAALEIGTKIMQAAKMVHDETVGVFQDYATQVRDMSRATGESAESSSRMIQMADDVGISYDKLKVSLQMAARQGIDTSVESLKGLSEEYLTLEPGTARMQFLLERFGRSGAEMGRLMEMGAAGIDKLNAGIEEGFILTDAILKQARAHDILVDTYQDLIQAQKIAAGSSIGELEDKAMLYLATTAQVRIMAEEQQALEGVNWSHQQTIYWMSAHRAEAEELVIATINGKMAADENAGAIAGLAEAEQLAAVAIEEVTAAQKGLEAAQQSWLASTANEVVSALQGLGVEGQAYYAALAAIDEVMGTQEAAEQAHKDAVKAITDEYSKTGDIEAFKTALGGLKDTELPQTTAALEDARSKAQELEEQLQRLKDMGELNIKVNYETVVTGATPPGNP